MSAPGARRSGACLDNRHPRLHQICPGVFRANPGNVERAEPQRCACPCHQQGTELHSLLHGESTAT